MTVIRKNITSKLVPVAAVLFAMALANTAEAQPTVRFIYGATSVELSDAFVSAIGGLGAHVDDISRASLRRGVARFPIPGGAIDLADLRGEILHLGGLKISAGATTVDRGFHRLGHFRVLAHAQVIVRAPNSDLFWRVVVMAQRFWKGTGKPL